MKKKKRKQTNASAPALNNYIVQIGQDHRYCSGIHCSTVYGQWITLHSPHHFVKLRYVRF